MSIQASIINLYKYLTIVDIEYILYKYMKRLYCKT